MGRGANVSQNLLHQIRPTSCACADGLERYGTTEGQNYALHACCLLWLTLKQLNGLDVSLAMIPPNHPLLNPQFLEAEAAGLLDRMLGVLQDNSRCVMPRATLS